MAMTDIQGSMRLQAIKHRGVLIQLRHVSRREHKLKGTNRRYKCMVEETLPIPWADPARCRTTEVTDTAINRPTTHRLYQPDLCRARECSIPQTLPKTPPDSSSNSKPTSSNRLRPHRLNTLKRNSNSLSMDPVWCITFLSRQLLSHLTTLYNLTNKDSPRQSTFCPTSLECNPTLGRTSRQVAACPRHTLHTLLHKLTLPLTRNRPRPLARRYRKRIRWE